jgi:pyridoxine kinase
MNLQQKIMSIQSCVSYGHVGNSAVTFPLQRLGVDVYPIHTVLFSNHTGYGEWKGQVVETTLVQDIFTGVKERGVLSNCHALLTGYMGSKELGLVMMHAYAELKKLNSNLIYCCDPVIGDIGRGIFVREGIPNFFKNEILQYADIITPNHFELEYLSDTVIHDVPSAIAAAKKLMKKGPKIVVVTSLRLNQSQDNIHVLAVNSKNAFMVTTPMLPVTLNGTGDITAALFTHFFLKTKNIKLALERSISRVYSIISKTLENGSRELLLVGAQKQLVAPEYSFKSIKIENN